MSTINKRFYLGKRCLVTGSAGFIGSALCRKLTEAGADVRGLDLRTHPHVDITEITEERECRYHFLDFQPEVVFHLAASTEVGVSFTNPRETYANNFVGTLNVLDLCRTSKSVKSLVVASSDKAYGPCLDPASDCDTPLRRSPNPYSNSKRFADELCRDYRETFKLPVRVLRSVNTYGPGQRNKTTLITRTVLRVLDGKLPQISLGEGNRREWLYIDDAVQAYLLVGALPQSQHFAFNVGTGQSFTPLDIVLALYKTMTFPPLGVGKTPYEEMAVPYREYDQRVDSSLFRSTFQEWTPLPFDEGLRRTIKWYQEQRVEGAL